MSKATPNLTMLNALTEFSRLTQDRIRDKSTKQLSVWRSHKVTAVTKWVELFGQMPLNRIERSHVIEFRDWLADRTNDKAMGESSAKHCFYGVHEIFRTVNRGLRLGLDDPFVGVAFGKSELRRKSVPHLREPTSRQADSKQPWFSVLPEEQTGDREIRRGEPIPPRSYHFRLKVLQVLKAHRRFEQDYFTRYEKTARENLSKTMKELRQLCIENDMEGA